ncbi:MAG: ribonuclease R [Maricaulaceae bacterium]
MTNKDDAKATIAPSPIEDQNAREMIMEVIRARPDKLTRKDIARALGIKGDDRRELRSLLRDMVNESVLTLSKEKTYREVGQLPGVMVIRAVKIDSDGDLLGEPDSWRGDTPAPTVIIREGPISKKSKGHNSGAVGVGDRALCRIKQNENEIVAQVMKRLGRGQAKHMGMLYLGARGWRIKPVDKRARDELRVPRIPEDIKGQDGSWIVFYRQSGGKQNKRDKYGRSAEIIEVLGSADDPKSASLISLRAHEIPIGFSDEVIAEAKALTLPELSEYRADLRDIPLLTIDPVDAKDFDDAIFAMPDEDDANKGGWVTWVAIADVAAFVKPGGALDREAEKKGNSVYLPDRVEPMLPEELSADLCSLRPHEDRACMAVRMRFDKHGQKVDHHFTRGLMKSHARLTYAQAQEGFMGEPGEAAKPVQPILEDIYKAYKCMLVARKKRAPLAIELPERRVHIGEDGRVKAVTVKERFDAHKLIEEFMVQANVAAAEALDKEGFTTLARVHEPPARERLQGLSEFLPTLGMKWSLGEKASTARFNVLLEAGAKDDMTETVSMAVLRSQSQAFYGPEIGGHFGLNLTHYAHFTSPIRRYADLVVHRALIKTFHLGEDGTTEREATRLKEIGEHISGTERRAMAAERDAKDRYIADYLEDLIGAEFGARISGVTNIGLFLTLDETGADGLIPIRTLGAERFHFDEKAKKLIGEQTGTTHRFGRKVIVRLKEATPVTGGLIFEMVSEGEEGKPPKRNPRKNNYAKRPQRRRRRP